MHLKHNKAVVPPNPRLTTGTGDCVENGFDDIDVWVRPQQDRVGSGLPDECVGVDGRRRDH